MKLERKIVMAMLGAVLAATLAFATVILMASDQLEHSLLDILVTSEADLLSETIMAHPEAPIPQLELTSIWHSPLHVAGMPELFKNLPLGISHDVVLDGQYFHILKRPLGTGILTVAIDISVQEQLEIALHWITALGGLGVILLIAALARAISRHVAAPLQSLASELYNLPANASPQPFSGRYQGAEVEIIAQALDRYVQRIGEVMERERGFSSAASHELRSPLTVIRSSLELALLNKNLPEGLRAGLNRAHTNCMQLALTLDGLMILARDTAQPNSVPIAATAVLHEVCKDLQISRPACELKLAADEPVNLDVPEAHWRILLNNLLRNTLDHAPGEPVQIILREDGLDVIDAGPGIPLDILPHVFERSRRSVQSSGAGLGLYITSEICKRHGWKIHADNPSSGGCRISINFFPDRVA